MTVALRKVSIALLGVFGHTIDVMQVHLTIMLMVGVILLTSTVKPFGGEFQQTLHNIEIMSLTCTFLTLWAGSVFNTYPQCEDPTKSSGETLVWCDVLSVTVGVVDIVVVAAIGFCFAYLKIKSMSTEVGEATAENGGEGSSFSEILSNARDSVQRWRFGRMTPEAQQRAIRRRTVDAADGNATENPVTIEMTGIYIGESTGEIKVDDGKVDLTRKNGGLMHENPGRRSDKQGAL